MLHNSSMFCHRVELSFLLKEYMRCVILNNVPLLKHHHTAHTLEENSILSTAQINSNHDSFAIMLFHKLTM